jgi:hypothetical protein
MGISGRYEAHGRDPHTREVLHLRVDVDRASSGAPVTNWISGDIFERNQLDPDRGKHVFSWRIEVPPSDTAEASGSRPLPFAFTGRATRLVSEMPGAPLPVSVEIRERNGPGDLVCIVGVAMADGLHTYEGHWQGPEFRTLDLAVAFCTTTFRNPDCDLIPPPAAVGVAPRQLRLVKAFAEVGVALKQVPPVPVTDLSNSDKTEGWTTSELHASLEAQLVSRKLDKESDWPRWFLWGLLADKHATGALGVMFDEKEPNRQGFAVFQRHNQPQLPQPGVAVGAEHVKALRLYFFSWMHEIGHGFNLRHSNEKSRAGALSWMNDEGALKHPTFWNDFQFGFETDEIVHIRHGDWREVVMGGLPLGRGGHLRESRHVLDGSPAVLNESAPPAPLRVTLNDGGYFDLMRPVTILVGLENQSDKPLPIRTDLSPEGGGLVVLIRRPDGRTVEYVPPVRMFRENEETSLLPGKSHGQMLHLTYGRDGFYFDAPGQYVLRAVYVGDGSNFIVSNLLRVRIGVPTPALDRLAQDFFTPDVGRCLYFGGSASPYLRKAMGWLVAVAQNELGRSDANGHRSWLGADIARVIAKGVATPFRYIDEENKIRRIAGQPALVAELTDAALQVYRSAENFARNPRYHQLVETREVLASAGAAAVGLIETLDDVKGIREKARKLLDRIGQPEP